MLFFRLDWGRLLDRLKMRMDLSDTALAAQIGLSKSMLSQCRTGARPLPLAAKYRLLDKLGYALTRDLILAALADEPREAITEADNKRAQRRAELLLLRRFLQDDVDELGVNARHAWYTGLPGCIDKDGLLADLSLRDALDLSSKQLRDVEAGLTKLPFWSKAAVLNNFDHSKLVALIESLPRDPATR